MPLIEVGLVCFWQDVGKQCISDTSEFVYLLDMIYTLELSSSTLPPFVLHSRIASLHSS